MLSLKKPIPSSLWISKEGACIYFELEEALAAIKVLQIASRFPLLEKIDQKTSPNITNSANLQYKKTRMASWIITLSGPREFDYYVWLIAMLIIVSLERKTFNFWSLCTRYTALWSRNLVDYEHASWKDISQSPHVSTTPSDLMIPQHWKACAVYHTW